MAKNISILLYVRIMRAISALHCWSEYQLLQSSRLNEM